MALSIEQIESLLTHQGAAQYGREAVSQLEHALQCAHLAECAGEAAETVAAALLHDLGHLLMADAPDGREGDDLHQFMVLPFLRPLFGDAVLEPVRLHVDAKRYLCLTEPGYFEGLSPASVRSLELQGGVFNAAEAADFASRPHAGAAIRLRRYDDRAKVPGYPVPPLSRFMAVLERVSAATSLSRS